VHYGITNKDYNIQFILIVLSEIEYFKTNLDHSVGAGSSTFGASGSTSGGGMGLK
jgi:hypothetical protein